MKVERRRRREQEIPKKMPSSRVHKTSVIIIGGGLSGLSAAKLLTEQSVDVIVLEARDRVGGRTYTVKNDVVGWVDLGGSYVGPTQNHILRLSHELGVDTYKVFGDLKSIYYGGGKTYASNTAWPKFGFWSPLAWFEINYVMHKMDKMMEKIPAKEPWSCPHAQEWDMMTLQHFFEKETWSRHALCYLTSLSEQNLAAEPGQVSLLWALWYVKCCGGTRRINDTVNGAQERKFKGGSMVISEKLHELLADKVHLNAQVFDLVQDESGVIVRVIDGAEYQADYAIMATPLPMQLKIHYEPPLPPLRNQLIQRCPLGSTIKINIYYKTPFWRKKGYNGEISSSQQELSFNSVMDDCRPGFSLAALTVVHKIATQRQTEIMLAKRSPVHYEEKNWLREQYSGGCYVSLFPTGVMSTFGKTIREPFHKVHFAGTETATSWPGYMNGAVQAGERAAREGVAIDDECPAPPQELTTHLFALIGERDTVETKAASPCVYSLSLPIGALRSDVTVLHAMGVIGQDEIWTNEPEFKEVPAIPCERSFLERHPPSVGMIVATSVFGTLGIFVGAAYISLKLLKAPLR